MLLKCSACPWGREYEEVPAECSTRQSIVYLEKMINVFKSVGQD